jgi:hypothetical protein
MREMLPISPKNFELIGLKLDELTWQKFLKMLFKKTSENFCKVYMLIKLLQASYV